ncbi:amidase domain-containing protein [Inediibacterium massiliense]|uniref:amidase domain-containing protein n=1 Tax=Inediibacterium massiliense TaxID=1658111 RepID=UPI0006B4A667|nr:amidase domain-containing protein [Inediibacterium massiliense]
MIVLVTIKKKYIAFVLGILIVIGYLCVNTSIQHVFVQDETRQKIQDIFHKRNQGILDKDENTIQKLYDTKLRYGIWAYEHEIKKMKYLHKWASKQGVVFTKIDSNTVVGKINDKGEKTTINLIASTTYEYFYENDPNIKNNFRIGTYHSLDVQKRGNEWVIIREWYTDPFADSMELDDMKTEEFKKYITDQKERDFSNMIERRKKALKYADEYCGAAAKENYIYNKKYINYNHLGGDCANFASQILYEGGEFRKNYTWNYTKEGSKSWINAHAFKNYMIYSGRASTVAYGTYDQVYKGAYKLLPGDFVAYEKKGKITHISVVTGADSKGYALVNSHNTDRYRVPWDLGWSDKKIKFHLVHVHF